MSEFSLQNSLCREWRPYRRLLQLVTCCRQRRRSLRNGRFAFPADRLELQTTYSRNRKTVVCLRRPTIENTKRQSTQFDNVYSRARPGHRLIARELAFQKLSGLSAAPGPLCFCKGRRQPRGAAGHWHWHWNHPDQRETAFPRVFSFNCPPPQS